MRPGSDEDLADGAAQGSEEKTRNDHGTIGAHDADRKRAAREAVVCRVRSATKQAIVHCGCWGLPPEWAHWLIVRMGLSHD